MNKSVTVVFAITFGAMLGGGIYLLIDSGNQNSEMKLAAEEAPLYWAAPMDANFRRDAPGKSPMGMDLVPVYAKGNNAQGLVEISPTVENNLGVRTAKVEFGPLRSSIRTVGYVRFDEDKLIHMHPRVEGWIETLNVKTEGEYIQAGQAVYSIYSPTLVSAQEELVLALSRNNQRLIQSAEERLLALQMPQSQIEQVKRSEEILQAVTVFATQNGVVAELGVREGQFVKPGNAILSIGVLDDVWVIAEVFERQVAMVAEGDRVTMTLDYLPGKQWLGLVDFIYPTLDERTRTISVRLRFENPEHELKPNMFAQVTFHSEEGQSVVMVPHEAIIRTGVQDRVVLALGEGRFKSVEVGIGRRGESKTEILSGLQAGDNIVTSAHFLLDSESSVTSDFMRMGAESPLNETVEKNDAAAQIDHSEHESMAIEQNSGAMDHSEHAAMDMSAGSEVEDDHSMHEGMNMSSNAAEKE